MNELNYRFAAEPEHLRRLRGELREGMEQLGIGEPISDRLMLIVDEIVSNSIEHGVDYRSSAEPLQTRIQLSEQRVLVEFRDLDMPTDLVAELATDLASTEDTVPAQMMERGRGLFLINEYLTELHVSEGQDGGMLLRGFVKG